jgi:GTP-binding protein
MKPVLIDEADVIVESGSGGGGSVHFLRARYLPKGGPDGGDGGRGGDVVLYARENLADLSDYLHKKSFKAESGAPGGANKQHGKDGADLRLPVPVGTQVYEAETMELLADLNTPGAEVTVALGGKGGKGNVHYKNSVRQAPRIAQRGLPGKRIKLRLIYKMKSDVGLIGLPNAGKSLFLSKISSATPKVAAYPYTTTVPQLGVFVPLEMASPLTFVEIPGIAAGKENRYLKHVERAKVLLILLELSENKTTEMLRAEAVKVLSIIEAYGDILTEKQKVLGLNKVDLLQSRESLPPLQKEMEITTGLGTFVLSAKTGEGMEVLLKVIEGFCTLEQS